MSGAVNPADSDSWTPFISPELMTFPQIVFMTGVYSVVLFLASGEISDGSEMLLLVPSLAQLVGSVVLPILGAVPDGMMVLMSGMGDDAQNQVAVGVGALAGSTIMLLTLPWFLAVYAGRVTVRSDGQLNYKRPPNAPLHWDKLNTTDQSWSTALFKSGVGIGQDIKENAKMMMLTTLSYLVIQVPAYFSDNKALRDREDGNDAQIRETQLGEARSEGTWALVGLCTCVALFSYYMYIEVAKAMSPDADGQVHDLIAETSIQAMKNGDLTLRGAMAKFRETEWATLCDTGDLDDILINKPAMSEIKRMCKVLAPFFARYDLNGDNQIDFSEFRMIFQDVHENLPTDTQKKMFEAADTDNSGSISFEEFVACLMSFALDPSDDMKGEGPKKFTTNPSMYVGQKAKDEGDDDDDDDEGDGDGAEEDDMPPDLSSLEPHEQQRRIKMRAFRKMAWGTFLVLAFSDPMVDLLSEIGKRLGVSAFYVSFILAPMASNASELVAAYSYAKKRTLKSMTTSLSCLEGAAIMNNTFCLGIFLGLVYFKNLAWEFTAETLVIVLIQVVIGCIVLTGKTHLLYHGVVVLSCYPAALALTWALENIAGLD